MTEAFSLTGKVALITGGGSGIGAATCRELSRAGAKVLVADINVTAAETIATELGGGARAVTMDVTNAGSIGAVVPTLPRLDILVNNAGIGHVGSVAEVSLEEFEQLMRVNVTSVFLVTQALLPLLLAAHGTIVNIGSDVDATPSAT